jgi:hypothetical protein
MKKPFVIFVCCTVTILVGTAVMISLSAPKQPPSAKPLTNTQQKQAIASDLSALSTDFASDDLGSLEWLDSEGASFSIKDSYLAVSNKERMPVWYSDTSGTLLYSYVRGNFMAETKLTSNLRSDIKARSNSRFTSAGLAVRDPASTAGKMRWVAYDFGFQDSYFGTEVKTTQNSNGFSIDTLLGNSSLSTWFLNPVKGSGNEAKMRICRVGSELRFFVYPLGAATWQEEINSASTKREGSSELVPGLKENSPLRLQRVDLPETVQVGIISNNINLDATGESRYDYLRFTRINNFDSCIK